MICDFCALIDPPWTYYCEPFTIVQAPAPPYQDDGMWAVCDPCHELIQDDDWEGLLDRTVQHDQDPQIDRLRTKFRILHNEFRSGFYGYERTSEEELNADHRFAGFRKGMKPRCTCGWEGTLHGNFQTARDEYETHSGGYRWQSIR